METVFFTDDRCPVARALAAAFARDGWRVVCNVRSDAPSKEDASIEYVRVDIRDRAALAETLRALGSSLRGVIHPAPPVISSSLEDATRAHWETAREEGPIAALAVTQAAADAMAPLGRGTVVYLGSVHAEKPIGQGFLLSLQSGATQMLCREAALCYGAQGLCFHYVMRGFVEEDKARDNPLSCLYAAPDVRHPQNRYQARDELFGLTRFLLTDAAAPLNGADLRADGGALLFYGKPGKEVRSFD